METPPVTSTDPKDLSGAWRMEQVTAVFPNITIARDLLEVEI